MAADSAMVGRVGQVLDRWQLDRLIGTGATAGVYEARDGAGKRVAIKVLHARFSADTQFKQRFLREARVADRVDHSGVVRVHKAGIAPSGDAYLVMDLLEGQTLEALRAQQGGRLTSAAIEDIARQVLAVLVVAHAQGVIHRDIKPANLFMSSEGRVSVLDFGIARSLEVSHASHSTATGALLGTPAFMAPEQARGRHEHVSAQTDLWALGATLFALLTGRHVHVAGTSNELLGLAMSAAAPRLLSVRSDVPPGLAHVIDRALEYEPAKRWPSAAAMREALEHPGVIAEPEDTVNSTALETQPRLAAGRSRARVVALAAIAAAGVAVVSWLARDHSAGESRALDAQPSMTPGSGAQAPLRSSSTVLPKEAAPAASAALSAATPLPASSVLAPSHPKAKAMAHVRPQPKPRAEPASAPAVASAPTASAALPPIAGGSSLDADKLLQRRH